MEKHGIGLLITLGLAGLVFIVVIVVNILVGLVSPGMLGIFITCFIIQALFIALGRVLS